MVDFADDIAELRIEDGFVQVIMPPTIKLWEMASTLAGVAQHCKCLGLVMPTDVYPLKMDRPCDFENSDKLRQIASDIFRVVRDDGLEKW